MCDYSLHLVANRPARVGDELVSTRFRNPMTRGFVAIGEPDVAVCLLPGTEVCVRSETWNATQHSAFSAVEVSSRRSRASRQVNLDEPTTHYDGRSFPMGR